jgi:hypothetical protein
MARIHKWKSNIHTRTAQNLVHLSVHKHYLDRHTVDRTSPRDTKRET